MTSQNYAYADDLALRYASRNWKAVKDSIDRFLNDALRIVTGCLRSTPTENLHVLAGIQPAELRRLGATLCLANCAIHDPDHVLHKQFVGQQDAHLGRVRSRQPFVPKAWKLLVSLSKLDVGVKQWTKHKWNAD